MPRVKLAQNVRRELYEHQQKCFDKAITTLERHLGFFLEMRLGKTLLYIRWILWWFEREFEEYCRTTGFDAAPILVAAPTTVLEAWVKELATEGEYYVIIQGLSPEKRLKVIEEAFSGEYGRRPWILTSYESLRASKEIALLPWYGTALDESTVVKNPESKIGQVATNGFRKVWHRSALSGSPAPEDLLDLYNQFVYLYGHFMGYVKYYAYRQMEFEISPYTFDWEPKPGSATKIKKFVHSKSFVVRRKDCDLGNKRIFEPRYIDMDKEQLALYKQVEEEFAAEFISKEGDSKVLETTLAIVKRTWMARIVGGSTPGQAERDEKGKVTKVIAEPQYRWNPKTKELISLIKGDLCDEQIVVFFRFNEEIRGVSRELQLQGIQHLCITGEGDRIERVRKLDQFRRKRVQVILCQVSLVKFGIDLSVSSTVIWYSLTHSGLEYIQALERIEHLEKKQALLYIYLLARNSIDEDLYTVMTDKRFNSDLFMTSFRKIFAMRRAVLSGKKGKGK